MNRINVQSLNECFNVPGDDFMWIADAEPEAFTDPRHSEFMKSFIRTPESNEKRRQTMKGKNTGPRSEETKRKISEALKGKKYKKRSEEGCRKISERMKGNDFGKYRKCCKKN